MMHSSITRLSKRCAARATLRVALLFVFSIDGPTTLWAASGGSAALPNTPPPGVKRPKPSGLSLTVVSSWLASNGYRPVTVSIVPTSPVTADRTLMIQLTPVETTNYYNMRRGYLGITQQVDIPAQSGPVTATISVPQYDAWGQLKIEVFEDGELVEDLSADTVYPNAEGGLNGSVSVNNVTNSPNVGRTPAVMQIGGAESDSSTILQRTYFSPWAWLCVDVPDQQPPAAMGSGMTNPLQLAIMPKLTAASLPERWIDYSGVDVYYVSLPKLQNFAATMPRKWAAIRAAVAAGANLWVYDVGNNFEQVTTLEKLLDLPPVTGGATTADNSQAPGNWSPPNPEGEFGGPVVDGNVFDNTTVAPPSTASKRRLLPFVFRSLGCGQVVAISASDPAAPSFNWNWLLNTAGTKRLIWTARHGLLLGGNVRYENAADFWEFLIPGVGLTPVLQFQLLISLFVIGIGPVNYFLLRRWRRLNLLLITVPASAAVVTLLLFGYALIHDGLGVRVRARSFTQLDLRRGEAVCWSRLSYYAGMSPSKGLTFPGDVAVYPLEQDPVDYRGVKQRPVELTWQAAEAAGGLASQHLSSDWLPARTPKQFITVRSRKTEARLAIVEIKPGQAIQVENRLGTRITAIAVSDATGTKFAGGELPNGQTATLVPAASGEALSAIHAALSANSLGLPPEAQGAWLQRSNNYYRSYPQPTYSIRTPGPGGQPGFEITSSGPMPQRDAMLEQRLGDWSQSLGPRRFVAIVERSPEVVLGLEGASEEASLHVVAGEW